MLFRSRGGGISTPLARFGQCESDAPDFEPFSVDRVIADGETVILGTDLSIEVIATPGHTRDAMSYYVPAKKILFTGEAAGVPESSGYIFSEWLSDYDDYLRSLRRLAGLDVETLCVAHGMVLTGREAAEYMPRAIDACLAFRERIEKTLEETGGDFEETKRRIKETEYDPLPEPKQPDFAYLLNLEAKIRAVIGKRE